MGRNNPGERPRDGQHCDLCGCSSPAVRCDKCHSQIFCLSCDDMYHRHPKRHFHLRKAVDTIASSTRPALPIKQSIPGDPSKMPMPPPRKKKPRSIFDTFRRGSSNSESPPLPRKEFSWSDKLGSIKRFMSNRPLPPLPREPSSGSSSPRHDEFFFDDDDEESLPVLPERNFPRSNTASMLKELDQTTQKDSPKKDPLIPLSVVELNSQLEAKNERHSKPLPPPKMSNQNGQVHTVTPDRWDEKGRASPRPRGNSLGEESRCLGETENIPNKNSPTFGHRSNQVFGTIRKHPINRGQIPLGMPSPITSDYGPSMYHSSSVTDLHTLSHGHPLPTPPFPYNHPNIAPPYPNPYNPYPNVNYPSYYNRSWGNPPSPSPSDNKDTEHGAESPDGRNGRENRVVRSHSIGYEPLLYPAGQYFPFAPYPPYGSHFWHPGQQIETPPSPASSVRSQGYAERSYKKQVGIDGQPVSNSPHERRKSTSSDRIHKSVSAIHDESSEKDKNEEEPSMEMETDNIILRETKKVTPSPSFSVSPSPPPAKLEEENHREREEIFHIDKAKDKEDDQKESEGDLIEHESKEKQKMEIMTKDEQDEEMEEAEDASFFSISDEDTRPTSRQDGSTSPWLPSKEWQCEFCTYINPAGTRICTICCKTVSRVQTPLSCLQKNREDKKMYLKGKSTPTDGRTDLKKKDLDYNNDVVGLTSALEEAEKEISRGLEELMKLKEESDARAEREKYNKNEKETVLSYDFSDINSNLNEVVNEFHHAESDNSLISGLEKELAVSSAKINTEDIAVDTPLSCSNGKLSTSVVVTTENAIPSYEKKDKTTPGEINIGDNLHIEQPSTQILSSYTKEVGSLVDSVTSDKVQMIAEPSVSNIETLPPTSAYVSVSKPVDNITAQRSSFSSENPQRRDSCSQTRQDGLSEYLPSREFQEENFPFHIANGHGAVGGHPYGYGKMEIPPTSPPQSLYNYPMFERGGGMGMMQRSHSRASLFGGRQNDGRPFYQQGYDDIGFGFGSSVYRSLSRASLTGENDVWGSEMRPLRKPDFYLSMEELVERRRQETMRAQGLELVRMIREAEQRGFTAEDIQVSLNNCGKQNPVDWLQENWKNMIETVVTLATNYGHDKVENDIGIISSDEARDALRLHKGNIWAAVTECVESRQRKFLELSARGSFTRKEIVAALTANQGSVEMAYAELTKATLKPFLMRIWGPGEGVESQEGALPRSHAESSLNKTTYPIKSKTIRSDFNDGKEPQDFQTPLSDDQNSWDDVDNEDNIYSDDENIPWNDYGEEEHQDDWEELESDLQDAIDSQNEAENSQENFTSDANKDISTLARHSSENMDINSVNNIINKHKASSPVSDKSDYHDADNHPSDLPSPSGSNMYFYAEQAASPYQSLEDLVHSDTYELSEVAKTDIETKRNTGFLSKLAALRKENKTNVSRQNIVTDPTSKSECIKKEEKFNEINNLQTNTNTSDVIEEATFSPFDLIKQTFAAVKETVASKIGMKPESPERMNKEVSNALFTADETSSNESVFESSEDNEYKKSVVKIADFKINQSDNSSIEQNPTCHSKVLITNSVSEFLDKNDDINSCVQEIKEKNTSDLLKINTPSLNLIQASVFNKTISDDMLNIKDNNILKTDLDSQFENEAHFESVNDFIVTDGSFEQFDVISEAKDENMHHQSEEKISKSMVVSQDVKQNRSSPLKVEEMNSSASLSDARPVCILRNKANKEDGNVIDASKTLDTIYDIKDSEAQKKSVPLESLEKNSDNNETISCHKEPSFLELASENLSFEEQIISCTSSKGTESELESTHVETRDGTFEENSETLIKCEKIPTLYDEKKDKSIPNSKNLSVKKKAKVKLKDKDLKPSIEGSSQDGSSPTLERTKTPLKEVVEYPVAEIKNHSVVGKEDQLVERTQSPNVQKTELLAMERTERVAFERNENLIMSGEEIFPHKDTESSVNEGECFEIEKERPVNKISHLSVESLQSPSLMESERSSITETENSSLVKTESPSVSREENLSRVERVESPSKKRAKSLTLSKIENSIKRIESPVKRTESPSVEETESPSMKRTESPVKRTESPIKGAKSSENDIAMTVKKIETPPVKELEKASLNDVESSMKRTESPPAKSIDVKSLTNAAGSSDMLQLNSQPSPPKDRESPWSNSFTKTIESVSTTSVTDTESHVESKVPDSPEIIKPESPSSRISESPLLKRIESPIVRGIESPLMKRRTDSPIETVRPQSPFGRMPFSARKEAIALERNRESAKVPYTVEQSSSSSNDKWHSPVYSKPAVTVSTTRRKSIKEQLAFERRVRNLVQERKIRTYKKAEIVVHLLDMDFDEEESINAAQNCSTLDQAIRFLQQDCELCTGKYPVNQMVSMIHCPHEACKECIRAYFTIQIRDRNIMELLCPFCNEPDISDEDVAQDYFNHLDIMLKKVVSDDIHELFQQKLRDRVLMKDPNFRWCSQCSSGFIANPDLKKLMCPDCGAITCAQCRKPWERKHENVTCEEFLQWKEANDPEIQAAGLAKHLTENGIDCPNCHFSYSLAKGGCMHFRCIQCQYDFCSGCNRPFKMGQKCGVSEFCGKLGLHAHHPRNCLFYLRDKEPEDLQRLLDVHDIPYNREPPEGMNVKSECQVMEQKESSLGLKDDICGRDLVEGYAGLCRVHYVEYLGQLVNKHKLDPITIFSLDDLELVLKRASLRLPPKSYRDSDVVYREKLVKVIQEELPLDKTEGS